MCHCGSRSFEVLGSLRRALERTARQLASGPEEAFDAVLYLGSLESRRNREFARSLSTTLPNRQVRWQPRVFTSRLGLIQAVRRLWR